MNEGIGHKDCEHCFRKYFTDADQCHVRLGEENKLVVTDKETGFTSIATYNKENDEFKFFEEVIARNSERDKYTYLHRVNFGEETECNPLIFWKGANVPAEMNCIFQFTYPEWYPELLRFKWLTSQLRFMGFGSLFYGKETFFSKMKAKFEKWNTIEED